MYSFAGLIRRMPPPTFSDTAITDCHSHTLLSSSELTGCGYPDLLDRKNRSNMCPRWESNPQITACKASTLSTGPGSLLPEDIKVKWTDFKLNGNCFTGSNSAILSFAILLTGDCSKRKDNALIEFSPPLRVDPFLKGFHPP